MGYKFIKTHDKDNKFDFVDMVMEVPYNEVTLSQLLETFKYFLQANGFSINGDLVIEEHYEVEGINESEGVE